MLSVEEVKKVAKLAQFNLSETELSTFQKLLSEALEYIEVLNELDTSQVEPTSQVSGLVNNTADDVASPGLSQTEALSNAALVERGFIVTKAVLNKHKQ